MLFINTRPTDRAQALTQCLSQAGYAVLDVPLLELRPKSLDPQLMALYQRLSDAQVIVVVSPTAVQIGMQYLAELGIDLKRLRHLQWIAVGERTAQVLQQFGCDSIVPEVENSEGMLSLPIFKNFQQLKTVAFWRGEGGRQLMMQHFAEQQVEVLNFVLYGRSCPSLTTQQFPKIVQQIQNFTAPYIVCISSEASWHNWVQLCQSTPELFNQCHYFVLGQRLAQLLLHDKQQRQADYTFSAVSHLNPTTVLNTLAHL